ncbi:MAG: hypothetical protein ACE5IW_04570 [bacterium]
MEANKFIGKVLKDGHLSLPEEIAKQVGKIFEVILLPVGQNNIYSYSEMIAKEKGFSQYTEKDIEKIIHESRGISD